jgi:hypothetical protein
MLQNTGYLSQFQVYEVPHYSGRDYTQKIIDSIVFGVQKAITIT